MAKPRKCPSCIDGIIKNHSAKRCWNCYNTKLRPFLQHNVSKYSGSGDKHPNWKGGLWKYWRKKVLERDDYTCKHCGLKDLEIMDVDHIIQIRVSHFSKRDEERNKDLRENGIDNLQTLCPNCHKRKSVQEIKYSAHLKSR